MQGWVVDAHREKKKKKEGFFGLMSYEKELPIGSSGRLN